MAKKKKDQKEEGPKTLMRDELQNLMTIMESDTTNILPKLKATQTKEDKAVEVVLEEISGDKKPILPDTKTGKVIAAPSFLGDEEEPQPEVKPETQPDSEIEDQPQKRISLPPLPPVSTKVVETPIEPAPIEAPISTRPSGIVGDYKPTGSLWGDMSVFFMELIDSYAGRYDLWEESINQILTILRKIQLLNQQNSEILIQSIEKCHEKIKVGLNRFKLKRDHIEKLSETDLQTVTKMLKKTLDLLSLQLKEIKLKSLLDQVFSVYTN
jgi:hypothetical protein